MTRAALPSLLPRLSQSVSIRVNPLLILPSSPRSPRLRGESLFPRGPMTRLSHISILSIILITGCTAQQLDQLRRDERAAGQIYAATTQATAQARQSLPTMPANLPARHQATKVITSAEIAEQTAHLAIALANAALAPPDKKLA